MSKYYDNAQHIDHSKTITINMSDDRAEALLRDFLRDDDVPLWKNKEEKIKYLLTTQTAESGFVFLLKYHDDEHPYPVEQKNRWLYGDFCAEVVFDFEDFNRMCYIMDYIESPEQMPMLITKWIRQFLKERPSFDYDVLKEELYNQIEEMMFDFTDCYFDYVGKERWGISLDYNDEHPECCWENINYDETFVRHFRLDIWKDTIMNYNVSTTCTKEKNIRANSQPNDITTPYPFILVRDNAEDIINLLRKYMSGIARNKPKDMMMPVRAAFDAGVIRKPTYSEFKEVFPRFAPKSKSSYTDYLVTDGITPNPYEKVPGYEEIVKAFKALVGN